MSSKRARVTIPLSLNDIIDELENIADDTPFPRGMTRHACSGGILPPDNANSDITDEDSDDEEFITLDNLPGCQLRAPAEIEYVSVSVSLSSLAKRTRITEEPRISEESFQPEPSTTYLGRNC